MTAVEKLREIVGQKASPSCRFALTAADFCELLQEIDRMRAESAGVRESCARICDERAKSAAEEFDPFGEYDNVDYARRSARADEAEDCAAAIRAGGKP